MKRLVLGIFVLLYSNYLLASGVKYIDGHNGNYAVTCTNGDKSGTITYHNNGQICALSNFINAKCKTFWSKEEAAKYICNHSATTGILKKDSLVLKTKKKLLEGLRDQGVWDIKKAFASTVTRYDMKVEILKIIKLKNKTFKYEVDGKKVIRHYIDDAVKISGRDGSVYFTKKSNIKFE